MPDQTSRKFVDLIWTATSKWANWDPGHEIKVGDYGKIDKDYGSFRKEGNIYEDLDIYDKKVLKKVKENPPKLSPRDDQYIATSSNVKRSDLGLSPDVSSVAGLAEASIQGKWTFGSKRGALLIMASPQSSYIPNGKILQDLASVKALKDMHLVTEVFFCPAYSLYLSSGNDDVVSLALVGSSPIPHAPGVTAGGQVGMKWWNQSTTGLFRHGHEPDGKDIYSPLFMLKSITREKWHEFWKRSEHPPNPKGDDLWIDIQPPWDPLDDDGNEDIFEDTVFD